ncbi:MAG: SDR family oxidoreductase [Lachnospiraceae bacterium]|nr:SDR family oxidoreductase [Lachnospiraceae bacterium]
MNKVYLITGASSEVGMAYIKKLDESVSENVTVIAHYRKNIDELMQLQKELSHVTLSPVRADLSLKEGAEIICNHIKEKQLEVTHVLHLAAPAFSHIKIKKWDEEKVNREMQIQFFSFASIMKEVLPKMAKMEYGRVCVMLSSYVLGTPPKFMSDYVAVKSALLGYVKSAAVEYGEKGVRVNGISPNMMETKFLQNIDEKIIRMTAESSILRRNINVEETVNGIAFLLSEDVSYVNGINLNLSGGDYML